MPGIPTQFIILEQTLKRLQAAPPGSSISDIGRVLADHPEYAHFGAVGATIGDFIPAGPGLLPQYVKVWHRVFDLMGGGAISRGGSPQSGGRARGDRSGS